MFEAQWEAEHAARRAKDERDRQLFLRFKQAMALSATKALMIRGMGRHVADLLAVEEAVEAAALELGLQERVHQEREPQLVGYSKVRRWPRYRFPTLLDGRTGALYQGRVIFWHRDWRRRMRRAMRGHKRPAA